MPSTAPTLTVGTTTYEWQENWAVIPEPTQGQDNRRTHGIAVSPATGNLIVFHQAEPAVLIYSPQGQLLGYLPLPVSRPTMCAFGDARLNTLYVTSLTENMSAAELAQEPLGGALFAVDMPVAGTPVAEFG